MEQYTLYNFVTRLEILPFPETKASEVIYVAIKSFLLDGTQLSNTEYYLINTQGAFTFHRFFSITQIIVGMIFFWNHLFKFLFAKRDGILISEEAFDRDFIVKSIISYHGIHIPRLSESIIFTPEKQGLCC